MPYEELLLSLNDIGIFVLRLAVGLIFAYHAFPKLKDAKGMAKMVGMPAAALTSLGLVEFLSAIALIIGLFTQVAAFALAIIMIGATVMKVTKWKVPFSAMDKTGWELDLLLLAATIAILTTGPGSIALTLL